MFWFRNNYFNLKVNLEHQNTLKYFGKLITSPGGRGVVVVVCLLASAVDKEYFNFSKECFPFFSSSNFLCVHYVHLLGEQDKLPLLIETD